MDRNRETRRASIVGSNGFNRRRHRTNSLRDSPDEDGGVEMQESIRLRERVKKDRDREQRDSRDIRERERDLRERERDLRERSSRNSSKRRRAERLITNRDEFGPGDTSEESVNDDEDDENEDSAAAATTTSAAGVRLMSPAVGSASVPNHHHHQQNHHSHVSNHHHNHHSHGGGGLSQQHNNNSNSTNNNVISSNSNHLQHRKTFPPSTTTNSSSSKVFKAPPVWKSGEEMINVSVPRKARTASAKRSHEWISSGSNNNSGCGLAGGDQNIRQASGSPVGQGLVSASTPLPAPPMSPSNTSMRKKLKPSGVNNNSGPKVKPPKVSSSSSKPSSSNPEELEIEIAEVLYGLMTQSQAPPSKKDDSRDVNRSSSDTKSRVSSPMSNSNSALGPNSSPLSAVAPKRKRPRQVVENSSYGPRSSPVSAKPEMDQIPKSDISSPNLVKNSGSVAGNGYEMGGNLVNSQGQPPAQPPAELTATGAAVKTDSGFVKPLAEELLENSDLVAKQELSSPKQKESSASRTEETNGVDSTSMATDSVASKLIKANSMVSEVENPREEKFEIDLMAPPPQGRSSPEREAKIDSSVAVDQKPVLPVLDAEMKRALFKDEEDEKRKNKKGNSEKLLDEEKKRQEAEIVENNNNIIINKVRNIDLQLDLEKPERDGGVNATSINKAQHQSQKQQKHQQQMPLNTEKSGQSTSSLPLPMSMASWPGGLPPMGYMAPLQGVVSMDGTNVSPAPIQPPFAQPRPKRCATHCYIARNINNLQQFMKMNPFWPAAAAGSAALFGSKNLNVMAGADLPANMAARGVNNLPDKAQTVASVPNQSTKDKGTQPGSASDSAQRKQQIMIQQALAPVAPNNLMGPAFIFPLNQQQAAVAAASARSNATKPPAGLPSSNTSASPGSTASAAAAAMSFNYPNMVANEPQYLAILQNNPYPFPIPAAVGAPPNYRDASAQAMPLFNGSFYSSQMIHPSQLQHLPQQPNQPQQMQQQSHQNSNASGSSSSSQKQQLQSQQPRPQSGGAGNSNLQNFPNQKSQSPQQLPQSQNQYLHPSRPTRHRESERGSEESPSIADSRVPRTSMNLYGQNFAMPIHPQNFAMMNTQAAMATAAAASGGSGNQSEKKSQQPQQQGQKTGMDARPPHSFAMSFGPPINGTTAAQGIDITAMAQNHAIFQSFPEATRQNIQMMAAAAAAQVAQKKNFRNNEDGHKSSAGGGDSSTGDDERKSLAENNSPGGIGQSIAFARSDLADSSMDGSARSVNVSSGPVRSSRAATSNTGGSVNVPNAHIQAQLQQQHQQMMQLKQHMAGNVTGTETTHQQMMQLKQHMAGNAASRSKAPVTSNGGLYSEHLNSSNMAAKFPNALSGFPQNLVQSNNNSPGQSPPWKSSVKAPISQAQSSQTSSAATTLKNLPQPHNSRTQPQIHTQISFGGNQKLSTNSQGQAQPSNNQAPSPPMMVGSPTTSSISKGASGSPRTSNSGNNKMGQAPVLSMQQQTKNAPAPSILGNPHIASSSSSSGAKPQMQQQSLQQQQSQQQQQQQHQLAKNMQHGQFFFSNPYAQATQAPHSNNSSNAVPAGYYMQQRRRPEQHQQQPPGASPPTSASMLSLASGVTNDPAKAIAAATSNVKGAGLPNQNIIHAAQFSGQSAGTLLPAGFSYVNPVAAAAAQAKPAEQKQPAGNDNSHSWKPEKK